MKRNTVVAAYVLEIVGDVEPTLRGPYKNPDNRDRAAKRLRAKDGEYENGIFALDLVKNGKARVWAYSAGFTMAVSCSSANCTLPYRTRTLNGRLFLELYIPSA